MKVIIRVIAILAVKFLHFDIKKILEKLNRHNISPRLQALFHPESKLILSTLYKKEVPNEDMSIMFNFLNDNKDNKNIFVNGTYNFGDSHSNEPIFQNKNKTEKKLDKEMVEKDQFWYRRGPSDDERLKKYQEELRRKEQLLKNHHIS